MDNFSSTPQVPNRFVGQGKIKFTREGGLAVRLTNRTGMVSEKGRLVHASTDADNAVGLSGTSHTDAMGVIYEDGREVGEEVWVVIYGIALVLLKDDTGSTKGYWVGVSDEAGYAYATLASPPAQPEHFREIGHCLQTVTATGTGTYVLCKVLIHFN